MTNKTACNFKANSATELVKQNYGKDFMNNWLSKAWITVKKTIWEEEKLGMMTHRKDRTKFETNIS